MCMCCGVLGRRKDMGDQFMSKFHFIFTSLQLGIWDDIAGLKPSIIKATVELNSGCRDFLWSGKTAVTARNILGRTLISWIFKWSVSWTTHKFSSVNYCSDNIIHWRDGHCHHSSPNKGEIVRRVDYIATLSSKANKQWLKVLPTCLWEVSMWVERREEIDDSE